MNEKVTVRAERTFVIPDYKGEKDPELSVYDCVEGQLLSLMASVLRSRGDLHHGQKILIRIELEK